MTEEITIFVSAMQYVGDEPVNGPEREFVIRMLYWTVLDARAIARRQAAHFKELLINRNCHRGCRGQGCKMIVLEQANESLRAWINCDQFEWYCELLHWDADRVRSVIIAISEGGLSDTLASHLMDIGRNARWEKYRGTAPVQSDANVCEMRTPRSHSALLSSEVWRQEAVEG